MDGVWRHRYKAKDEKFPYVANDGRRWLIEDGYAPPASNGSSSDSDDAIEEIVVPDERELVKHPPIRAPKLVLKTAAKVAAKTAGKVARPPRPSTPPIRSGHSMVSLADVIAQVGDPVVAAKQNSVIGVDPTGRYSGALYSGPSNERGRGRDFLVVDRKAVGHMARRSETGLRSVVYGTKRDVSEDEFLLAASNCVCVCGQTSIMAGPCVGSFLPLQRRPLRIFSCHALCRNLLSTGA